jgi:heterodisulfide reductase subunit C
MANQILFLVVLIAAIYILYQRIKTIKNNIRLGKELKISGNRKKRWKNVLLIAFGQKKMFRRIVPAVFHFLIYVGFIIINIEIIEFILDGLSGQHRIFAVLLGAESLDISSFSAFYNVLMNIFEFLCLGVILACIIFLIRRNILRTKRFTGIEMTRWPVLDANLILIFEIILMIAILTMNAADQVLQDKNVTGYINTGPLILSGHFLLPLLQDLSTEKLLLIERSTWWLHIIGIFGFAIYVTYSKHLHIFMAFPNTYYSSLEPMGIISNMDDVMNEVKMMLGMDKPDGDQNIEIPRFGVKDITDLTWKNIMDAYTCTECGRCTSVCPANITGKKLSPRKIIMDVRDRVELWGKRKGVDDKGSLFDYISKEEIFACTTCNACIDICPVGIDPVSVIIGMRRYTAMEESSSPGDWNIMFNNIETNFAPWKFPATDRMKWIDEIQKSKN